MPESQTSAIARLQEQVRNLTDDRDEDRAALAELRRDTRTMGEGLLKDIRKNAEDIGALRRFQSWLLGGAAVLGAVISHFAGSVLEKLK